MILFQTSKNMNTFLINCTFIMNCTSLKEGQLSSPYISKKWDKNISNTWIAQLLLLWLLVIFKMVIFHIKWTIFHTFLYNNLLMITFGYFRELHGQTRMCGCWYSSTQSLVAEEQSTPEEHGSVSCPVRRECPRAGIPSNEEGWHRPLHC